ncbi:MAG: VOC family protein [Phycisphaerales bacterium]
MKLLTLLGLLTVCAVSVSCSTSRAPQSSNDPLALAFDHQALQVADLSKSAAFYSDVLGLAEIAKPSGPEIIRWFDLGNGNELHLIALDEPQTVPKATHFALSVQDLDAFLTHLRSRGIRYSDWPGTDGGVSVRADGVRQVYIQDPDGHWIEINTSY